MNPDAVKPLACPFCGKSARTWEDDFGFRGVSCSDTECSASELIITIEQWNRRTPPAGWKREDLEHLRHKMVGFADRAYCTSLDVARTTQCLGWKAKVKNGTYGESEHSAHGEHNNLDGKHRGAWECIRMLDAMLSAALENDAPRHENEGDKT